MCDNKGSASEEELRQWLFRSIDPKDRGVGHHTVGRISLSPFVLPSLLLDDQSQVVAYYNVNKRLAVAYRDAWGAPWNDCLLDDEIGWDSHNFPSLGRDRDGRVHLVSNMHASIPRYFVARSSTDISTFSSRSWMVSESKESSATYPRFLNDAEGRLTFWFRDGSSGNGVQRFYRWNDDQESWVDPLNVPLIDGQSARSAYLEDYVPRDTGTGEFSMTWVWRDSPDAESTHTICYAKSADMLTWFDAFGVELRVPLLFDSAATIGEGARETGLINNNVRTGHSFNGSPVIVFHQRDRRGFMQIFSYRASGGSWVKRQLTDWNLEWDFSGRGSLNFIMEIGSPIVEGSSYRVDVRHGNSVYRIEHHTDTDLVELVPAKAPWPGISSFPSQELVRGLVPDQSGSGILTWTATPPNRDQEVVGLPGGGSLLEIRSLRESG